jgi:hypothetical protein
MKYYLCGPIDTAGRKDLNVQAFADAAKTLRLIGYEILSPTELGTEGQTYDWFIRRDIGLLIECDAIILLPGWPQSKGARAELQIAMNLNMKVYFYNPNRYSELLDMNFD